MRKRIFTTLYVFILTILGLLIFPEISDHGYDLIILILSHVFVMGMGDVFYRERNGL